jgi:hypothetical protein
MPSTQDALCSDSTVAAPHSGSPSNHAKRFCVRVFRAFIELTAVNSMISTLSSALEQPGSELFVNLICATTVVINYYVQLLTQHAVSLCRAGHEIPQKL